MSEEATADVPRTASTHPSFACPRSTTRSGRASSAPWIAIAREKGAIAYIGEGRNRWPAAHISDVARLYRLAIEKSEPGAIYNAVGEGRRAGARDCGDHWSTLKLPVKSITTEEAGGYFGWLAHLAARDMPASSELTQKKLDGGRPDRG